MNNDEQQAVINERTVGALREIQNAAGLQAQSLRDFMQETRRVLDDHELRIRSNERFGNYAVGVVGLISLLISAGMLVVNLARTLH